MPKSLDRIAYGAAVLFLPACAGVIGGEIGPAASDPDIWDKLLHFGAYFTLSLLAVTAVRARITALWAMLGLIAMGGVLEIIQGLVGRDCDIYDEAANTLGVLAGGAIAWALVRLVAHARRA